MSVTTPAPHPAPAGTGPVLDRLRCLAGRPWSARVLEGGLTNRNVFVQSGPDRYVVRIGHPAAGLLGIDRDHEHLASVAAAAAGVGAPVVEYRPDLGALVVGWLDAPTCTPGALADPARLQRVVAACRRLHAGPAFAAATDMLALHDRFLAVVTDRGYRRPDRYGKLIEALDRARSTLAAGRVRIVPCHNDLLAGNCLDDGRRVWLIDYEYAGGNDPCFELGNLWSEAGLEPEALDAIVGWYFGAGASPALVARARLQGLVSKCVWVMWAAIQDSIADLDFDFWSWGMEKYDRAVAEIAAPGFDRLLDTAAIADAVGPAAADATR